MPFYIWLDSFMPSSAAAAQLRRLEHNITIAEPLAATDGDGMPDETARALAEIYNLWELRRVEQSLPSKTADQDTGVEGDPDGELVAALAWARGEITHQGIEFREFAGLSQAPLGTSPLGVGSWVWPSFSAPTKNVYAKRYAWYQLHVQGDLVVPVLTRALKWFSSQLQ